MFERAYNKVVRARLEEPRKFIQIVTGPRQVGKTTLVKQVLSEVKIQWLMFSADNVPTSQREWISECWEAARRRLRLENLAEIILVIDEVQKIKGWSEVVKKLWDEDTFNDTPVKVLLLGSSRVLLERGLWTPWLDVLRRLKCLIGRLARCVRLSVSRWINMSILGHIRPQLNILATKTDGQSTFVRP